MPTRKKTTAASKGQPGIESFLSEKKRRPPQRITSPTNQTSSPDTKKAAVETSSPEITSNEPDPILVSPQRDKFERAMKAGEDKDGDVVMQDTDKNTRPEKDNQCNEDSGHEDKGSDNQDGNPQEESGEEVRTNLKLDESESVEKLEQEDQVQKPKTLKSLLKKTYKEAADTAAHLPEPAPIIPSWEAH